MAEAVSVRRDGDSFQARMFWLAAAELLDPHSAIQKIGFETGPKSFDDIWIEYDTTRSIVLEGKPLRRRHIQCKWHVAPESYGYASLIDPDFISAKARSLLQRAHAAQLSHAPDGTGLQFKLVSNWRLDHNDPLITMISNRSGGMRIDRLYEGKTDNSRAGKVRKSWREHLGIDEDALRILARTLAFAAVPDTLMDLRVRLDHLFGIVGLRRIPEREATFPYDDIPFQWMAQGQNIFDRATFTEICKRENLLGQARPEPKVYGVKSFEHPFDRLEDRCGKVLDLVPSFDDRHIRSEADWDQKLYPQLREFLISAAKETDHLRLALDAHVTLAFAAGSVINVKSGKSIELEQRTLGRHVWSATDIEIDTSWPNLVQDIDLIDPKKSDLAVAIGLTHDIAADVSKYCVEKLPSVQRILNLKPSIGPSAQSVRCGRHAAQLADAAINSIRQAKLTSNQPIHLFVAAPNIFTYFLGQRYLAAGNVLLYEFDFEQSRTYAPALSLPLKSATN